MKGCELCEPKDVVFESDFAYVRYDSNSLSKGHVIVVPRRHVADFFDMSAAEQGSVLALLNRARRFIHETHKPDGYNIGVNVGKAPGRRACMSTCTSFPAMPATCPTRAAGCAACSRKRNSRCSTSPTATARSAS